jgi:chitinase
VLTRAAAYGRLGVTPMIGQNDELDDRLTIDGAHQIFDTAIARGVARFSMWSLNRDVACGGNVDLAIADNACSGVDQDRLEFSSIFGGVDGRATSRTAAPDVAAKPVGRTNDQVVDAVGPYEAWRERREYEAADKVVWRGQVYVAKWWNVRSEPDAPVPHEWDSPWRPLGPVLPGEQMAPDPPALEPGTHPEWRRTTPYRIGDVVQHLGKGYRAKWATQGDDPAADVDNEWESPWGPLTAVASDAERSVEGP